MTTATVIERARTGARIQLSSGICLDIALRGDEIAGYIYAAQVYSDGGIGSYRQLCKAGPGRGPAWRGATVMYRGARGDNAVLLAALEKAGLPVGKRYKTAV